MKSNINNICGSIQKGGGDFVIRAIENKTRWGSFVGSMGRMWPYGWGSSFVLGFIEDLDEDKEETGLIGVGLTNDKAGVHGKVASGEEAKGSTELMLGT